MTTQGVPIRSLLHTLLVAAVSCQWIDRTNAFSGFTSPPSPNFSTVAVKGQPFKIEWDPTAISIGTIGFLTLLTSFGTEGCDYNRSCEIVEIINSHTPVLDGFTSWTPPLTLDSTSSNGARPGWKFSYLFALYNSSGIATFSPNFQLLDKPLPSLTESMVSVMITPRPLPSTTFPSVKPLSMTLATPPPSSPLPTASPSLPSQSLRSQSPPSPQETTATPAPQTTVTPAGPPIAIIGGVIGGVATMVVISALVAWRLGYFRRREMYVEEFWKAELDGTGVELTRGELEGCYGVNFHRWAVELPGSMPGCGGHIPELAG